MKKLNWWLGAVLAAGVGIWMLPQGIGNAATVSSPGNINGCQSERQLSAEPDDEDEDHEHEDHEDHEEGDEDDHPE